MFSNILTSIKRFFSYLKSSIAFYPSVIAVSIILLGLFLMHLDNSDLSEYIQEVFPLLIVQNIDTARTILGTIIGALISLMVFSFSQVMVVLNQAASNSSPRLLPGLIASKKHQIVLGTYLGAIVFALLTLLRMEPTDYNDYLPALGVIYSVLLSIICLGLFVYFIHSISTSIQISKIILRLYKKTRNHINYLEQSEHITYLQEPDLEWHPLSLNLVGYIRDYDLSQLASINKANHIDIKTAVPEGAFLGRNSPSFYTSKQPDENLINQLKKAIFVDDEEWANEHSNIGIKQMIEVILKGMSPGVNDPGTALTALDYLGDLLLSRKGLRRFNAYMKDDGRVFINALSFPELLRTSYANIRQYVRHDVVVMKRLLEILLYLQKDEFAYEQTLFHNVIQEEAKRVIKDARFIENEDDRKLLNDFYKAHFLRKE